MRRSFGILLAFFLLGSVSAQLGTITGAVNSVAALGSSVAKLTGALLPSGLLLPAAATGPVKLSVPLLLGLKGFKLFKLKLLLAKAPLLAPIGVATAKYGLLKAKYRVGKAAVKAAGKTTADLIDLPVKLTAAKIGAMTGAVAGAKAGLLRYNKS